MEEVPAKTGVWRRAGKRRGGWFATSHFPQTLKTIAWRDVNLESGHNLSFSLTSDIQREVNISKSSDSRESGECVYVYVSVCRCWCWCRNSCSAPRNVTAAYIHMIFFFGFCEHNLYFNHGEKFWSKWLYWSGCLPLPHISLWQLYLSEVNYCEIYGCHFVFSIFTACWSCQMF